MKTNIIETMANIQKTSDAIQQIGNLPLARWAMGALIERFSDELTEEQKAQLDANYVTLSAIEEESRRQAGDPPEPAA